MKHFILGATILGAAVYFTCNYEAKSNDRKPAIETEIIEVDTRPQDVDALAKANGFRPSQRIIDAIIRASNDYGIDALELTAIGIIETGLGKYTSTRKNNNGTYDKGIFQINTVNYPKCVEYNLDSPEGSALCAAKLLSSIKAHRPDYLGVYHSKTPSLKTKYLNKVSEVLNVSNE